MLNGVHGGVRGKRGNKSARFRAELWFRPPVLSMGPRFAYPTFLLCSSLTYPASLLA